jgi:hypothetical protein
MMRRPFSSTSAQAVVGFVDTGIMLAPSQTGQINTNHIHFREEFM